MIWRSTEVHMRTSKMDGQVQSKPHVMRRLPQCRHLHAHSSTSGEPINLTPSDSLSVDGESSHGNKRQMKVMLRNEMQERIESNDKPLEPDVRGPRDNFFLDADQRQLTAKIMDSKHARELHAHIVQAGPRVVNAIHVGLAFQKVAKLHPGGKGIGG